MQGNGHRVPLGMDSRWRDERAGCTRMTGIFGTTTREHERKKETYQTWFTSTTRRSEYKYGIAKAHVAKDLFVRGCWWLGDEERLRLWCCGKELWGLGWATDVVCTQQLGEEQRRVWSWGGTEETGRATGETLPLVRLGRLLSHSNGQKNKTKKNCTSFQPISRILSDQISIHLSCAAQGPQQILAVPKLLCWLSCSLHPPTLSSVPHK